MLRFPLRSMSGLASQLGYRHFQAKLSPILYTIPLCSHDEKRTIFSQAGPPILKRNIPLALQACVLHTSSSSSSEKPPKIDLQDLQKDARVMLKAVNFQDFKNAPKPIQTLGIAGLIPFVLPPVAILFNGAFLPNMALAQLAYGCTILAFLGGVKWGFTLPPDSSDKPNWENLTTSVAWPLVAWASLLLPQFLGTLTLMGGIAAAAYIDFMSGGYPAWFKSVRLFLSALALGSLLFMLLLRIIF